MLKTNRLLLRQWTDQDFLPFAKMCADPAVMEFFPNTLTRSDSDAMAEKIQSLIKERGWGLWAVEIPSVQSFIGFVGLHIPTSAMPFSPCVEIGWRLAKPYWGQGFASEAAQCVLDYAFNALELDEVVAFTTLKNTRSRQVMKRIGMHNSGQNFMHPDLDLAHPLCEHVLYKINRPQWSALSSNN